MWDPDLPLFDEGKPYVIRGTVKQFKSSFCQLWLPLADFYYLEVAGMEDVQPILPSSSDEHFSIPVGYAYHNVDDVIDLAHWDDQVCTIGLVTERYPLEGSHYVRLQLLNGKLATLTVKVPASEPAPYMGSMALYCGTLKNSGGQNLHPGWILVGESLDTTVGQGYVEILQGGKLPIFRHESLARTSLTVEVGSPVDIHIYDSEGNHTGVLYDSDGTPMDMETQIPTAEYYYGVDNSPEFVSISNPTTGPYTVTIRGTDVGVYTQTIKIFERSGLQTYTMTLAAHTTFFGKEDTIVFDEIPAAPTGLELDVDPSTISLDWDDNTEGDLAGYSVYRSTQANGVYQRMSSSLLSDSSFTDSLVDGDVVYYYYVTAEDLDHNESGHHAPVASIYFVYLPTVVR
jgi:hypothetical protein